MKVTVRIPTEQYAYVEAEFDSILEYEKEYPILRASMVRTRHNAEKLRKEAINDLPPF